MDSVSRKTEGEIPNDLADIGDRMTNNKFTIEAKAAKDTIAPTILMTENSIRTGDRMAVVTAKTIGTPHRTNRNNICNA
jgi:hypothetical protein